MPLLQEDYNMRLYGTIYLGLVTANRYMWGSAQHPASHTSSSSGKMEASFVGCMRGWEVVQEGEKLVRRESGDGGPKFKGNEASVILCLREKCLCCCPYFHNVLFSKHCFSHFLHCNTLRATKLTGLLISSVKNFLSSSTPRHNILSTAYCF